MTESVRIVKTCLACKHGDLDFGCSIPYSKYTPGEDPSFHCPTTRFYLWDLHNLDQALIDQADGCEHFEVADHLKSNC